MSANIPALLRKHVYNRAGGVCEYRLMPEFAGWATHEMDHVVPQKHGGATEFGNLAISCVLCNKHEGSDIASIDPETGNLFPFFGSRFLWAESFFQDTNEFAVEASSVGGGGGLQPLAKVFGNVFYGHGWHVASCFDGCESVPARLLFRFFSTRFFRCRVCFVAEVPLGRICRKKVKGAALDGTPERPGIRSHAGAWERDESMSRKSGYQHPCGREESLLFLYDRLFVGKKSDVAQHGICGSLCGYSHKLFLFAVGELSFRDTRPILKDIYSVALSPKFPE